MFNPNLNTRLNIDGVEYTFAPHPAVPSLVWAQEGRHATVYRIQDRADAYGLKVFRPAFRHPGLITTAESLWTYHELPGMLVCKQAVITREGFPELVGQYEDLDYAMVMPWITGDTWFDVLGKRQRLTLDQSRALAESMAWVLYALELNQLAHCDLSSGNVIVDPHMDTVNMVDVEDLYSPWLEAPPMVPAGSAGYQHKESSRGGQWSPMGDRFAGVVLMAEMLGWAHPEVRKSAWGESYFAPDELQKSSERFDTLLKALKVYDPGFAETFEAAWRSEHMEDCPPLKTWYDLLDALPRDPVASWAPINHREFQDEIEALEPPKKARGFLSSGPSGQPEAPGRAGCRVLAYIGAVLMLFICCAAALVAAWTAVIANSQ
jgi:serine/threonine protein kinase